MREFDYSKLKVRLLRIDVTPFVKSMLSIIHHWNKISRTGIEAIIRRRCSFKKGIWKSYILCS